ncbi:hypothetical protein [Arthrobacter sp. UYCo732]|uniref:hypothetical protein n=1 Tax=Arthrobacter sp. UYCo732 TaxID=3156336 RepID=UPI0033972C07
MFFTTERHAFETDGKHLWVTPPGSDRIDRIKVTRYLGDRSVRQGYPRELIRPEPMTEGWARSAAVFWLDWSVTADAAAFPSVHLDHFVRKLELETVPAAAAHMG